MQPVPILSSKAFGLTVRRLCHQLIEEHGEMAGVALVGLQPRGVLLARRLRRELKRILGKELFEYGELDITFHRDDFRHRATPPAPSATQLDFSLDDRKVVLVDDVLYTGRTIRAGLDAMLAFGRPAGVELLVLIDRRFSRELPIQPDYVGRWVDSIGDQRVTVEWAESDGNDQVLLHTTDPEGRNAAATPQGTSADR
ncbi:MAG: bifunctional pyr operon transcriptional regulator/uracil phosphoribosyltransferase PyrR [Flavobacteriales bacterium]|nr:bifunctional pyr operon transcriptional regulator/uracil phosphoribosyltransferase PyrR [Flavobacteriales bacterium]MCB0780191.1 bifunctional pyr operon transcriptional regulator/uracil phosphoribosyltransferase PyrR [Flavobacteriales bacterium]